MSVEQVFAYSGQGEAGPCGALGMALPPGAHIPTGAPGPPQKSLERAGRRVGLWWGVLSVDHQNDGP